MSRGTLVFAAATTVTLAAGGYWYWNTLELRRLVADNEAICRVLRESPGEAIAFLQDKVEGPAQMWGHIERCGAPDGDDCDHALVGMRSMPTMAKPTKEQLAAFDAEYLETCRSLPAETQRCLVISHVLAQPKACDSAVARKALKEARTAK